MIQVTGLTKHFGRQVLFENISFSMIKGEKLGLVGRNGSGKSTLLRIILGEVEADSGKILPPRGYLIGSLPQHIRFTEDSVLAEGCKILGPHQEHEAYKVEKILCGLGFAMEDLDKDPNTFSGGFQIRINLAKALVQSPNMLLLDEPTNYLDIVSQRWLEEHLQQYKGEIILISHDRQFMDRCTNHTMGFTRQALRKVKGTTLDFYEKIAESEDIHEKTVKNKAQQRKHMEKYISRFRSSARRASQAQSRIKQLSKMDDLKSLNQERTLEFRFNYTPCPARNIMKVQELDFHYPEQHNLMTNTHFVVRAQDRIGIIGKNGKGKSTLLNILAGELAPTRGAIVSHPLLQIGHFGQTNILRLSETRRIVDEISEMNHELTQEQIRTICGVMLFEKDLALKPISQLSGGERSRVLLGKILARKTNLLLLDEPTNHLDQESIEGLIEGLNAFEGAVIIVTHSEMILHALCNKLVVFHRNRVEALDGDYQYFLDKYGWDETEDLEHKQTPALDPEPVLSKKELRQNKSEIIQQKSKALNPLAQKIKTLEAEIISLEAEIKTWNETLITASQNKNIETFIHLSKQIKTNEKKIEQNFNELEKTTLLLAEKQTEFEMLLAQASDSSS